MSVSLRSLIGKLNETSRSALESGAGLCLSRTNYEIEIEHFLLKLLDVPRSDLAFIAKHFGVDPGRVAAELSRSMDKLKTGNARSPAFGSSLVEALIQAWVYGSLEYEAARIRSGFVVIALLADAGLAKLTRDISPTLCGIDVAALRRDFAAIVAESVEPAGQPAPGAAAKAPPGGSRSAVPRVFISYRREDAFYADSLFDRLLAAVENVRVFRDTDTLRPGDVYSEKIDETVGACDIFLALIGKKWISLKDAGGTRKLDKPDDWVRLEIAAALRHGKTVVPCLLAGAKMPRREELPADLAGLELRNAVSLSQTSFRHDSEDLVRMIQSWRPSAPVAP
jgi:hypothetical protein